MFQVPDFSKATGLLRTVLDTRTLRVGSLGQYDWGGNDGNYKLDTADCSSVPPYVSS